MSKQSINYNINPSYIYKADIERISKLHGNSIIFKWRN